MTESKRIIDLNDVQRQQLEVILAQFEHNWTTSSISEQAKSLADSKSEDVAFSQLGLVECIKRDLPNCWAEGKRRLIESYFELPLFDSKQVEPELLLVEYNSRRRTTDPKVALDSYQKRFPHHFDAFQKLANSVHSRESQQTVAPSQSILDTQAPKGSTQQQSADGLNMPLEFGRYKVLRQIGSGAMGSVHLAYDSQLDREVALKTPSFEGAETEQTVARFYQEARSAAKLQHRNICPIYDVGQIEGRHFISMAYIKGKPLSDFISEAKLPSEKSTAILFHRLASGLDEAHRQKIIHRDLKPANVMIDSKREPVVMDFGLARRTDAEIRMTKSGALMGTPAYMSPEQVSGDLDTVGPQSDIYSLGVMLYEVLTGKLPFNGSLAQVIGQILQDEPKPPTSLNANISEPMEAICLKMMAKDRNARYQSMSDVAKDLKNLLKGDISRSTQSNQQQQTLPSTQGKANFDSQSTVAQSGTVALDYGAGNSASNLAPGLAQNSNSSKKWLWIAAASVIGLVSLASLYFLMPKGKGTLKIETAVERLEILVDGDTMALNQSVRLPVGKHNVEFRYNGSTLDPVGEGEFAIEENERRFVVEVNGLKHSRPVFEIERGEITAMRVTTLLRNKMSKMRPGAVGERAIENAKAARGKRGQGRKGSESDAKSPRFQGAGGRNPRNNKSSGDN